MIQICREATPRTPSDSDIGTEFLRERVVYFARVAMAIILGYYLVWNAILTIGGKPWRNWILHPTSIALLAAVAVNGGIWAACRRCSLPARALRMADAGGTFLVCIIYPLGGVLDPEIRALFPALLGLTNTLLARAVIVPSRAAWTFAIGAVSAIPLVATEYLVAARGGEAAAPGQPWVQAALFLLWGMVASVVSAVASWTIFGLRREVSEARRLGQYTLEDRIGAGGMGEVFRASHALLRRPTAIKLLRRERAGDGAIARFEREVQLTSRLTHPNTISIYDYCRTPDGTFYYAMEYLPGIDLEALLRREDSLPAERVIHILRQVCGSLAEAHAMGLIHRDIKAANVILCERGGAHDVVKVVDFGLVKDVGHGDILALSGINTITGTPLFLSPEAIRSPASVDARSDLYSVGVLGYYLLAGKPPFEGASFVEVCSHHLHSRPLPPSDRTSRPVPADIEETILACLEKEPGRRPQSAEALARTLEGCADAGRWTEEKARAWWRSFEDARGTEKARAARPAAAAATLVLPQRARAVEPAGS